ncbi:MAG: ubiquinone biosynthesis accessory factor UbiJ [Thiolinea sp.]
MLLTTLTAVLETAFNAWLKLDEDANERLQVLQGRVIALNITNPGIRLYFIPTHEGVNVMSQYDCPPDVCLTGSALAFMRLSGAENSAKTMLENQIQIEGSMALAEQFSTIIREIDVDWEELLSHAVGDIVAHQAGQLTRTGKGWLDDTAQAMRMNTSEYLQEESRILPAEAEVAMYMDAVDTLRNDVDRMDARINRLEPQQTDQNQTTSHTTAKPVDNTKP